MAAPRKLIAALHGKISPMNDIASMRLDKWLWCARFYKTRGLAVEEIGKGRVCVNGAAVKPAREVRVGDTVALRQGTLPRTVVIRGLSAMRGPAPVAQALYEETPDSIAERARLAEQRRLAPEPAGSIAALRDGRPTKRDRRQIDRQLGRSGEQARSAPAWDQRWSASWDD